MEVAIGRLDELRVDTELVAVRGARHGVAAVGLTEAWPDVPLKVMLSYQTTLAFV